MEIQEKIFKKEDFNKILKPGYSAYVIYNPKTIYQYKKCPICKGEDRIIIEGKEFPCPEGTCIDGKIRVPMEVNWTLYDGILSNLDYIYTSNKNTHIITRTEIELVDKTLDQYKVMYWFGCNGYPACNVFKSKKEAINECNARNAILEQMREKENEEDTQIK